MSGAHSDSSSWERIEPLLQTCIELPESEREEYLRGACGPETAAVVLGLLEREARADESGYLVPPGGGRRNAIEAGSVVGAWRLVERIGEGGMGTVWLAERADGAFAKRVAVKLLKFGLLDPRIERRFQTEVQILASLDHPSIARFLDGGRTEADLPYLVLELVDGEPIDAACDALGLDLRGRIELFLRVCDAVQHAHERGVLHRDIKPSNVLVGSDGVPRLLDFGIAKVVGELEGVETIEMTRTGQRLYSPRYASPEQIRGAPTQATSDVYALGVVLYELLTGRAPHSTTAVSQFELERAALEDEVMRPSRAVTRPATRRDGGHREREDPWRARRLSDARQHRRELSGDLDCILLTALRKEPERRYATAADLASDLRRYLEVLPVRARPESPGYRARRFVRRNRLVVGAAIAVFAALSIGLVLALAANRRAERAALENEHTAYREALGAAAASLVIGEVSTARESLERQPEHLRGWEWRHLMSRTDASTWHVPGLDSALEGEGIAIVPEAGVALVEGRAPRWIDLRSGDVLATYDSYPVRPLGLAAHPGGREVAMGDSRGNVTRFDVRSFDPIEVERVSDEPVYDVAYAPDGRTLAWADYAGRIALVDLESGAELRRWPAHGRGAMVLQYSPSGDRLASVSWDGVVAIWDPTTGERLAALEGHERWVTDAAWARDGRTLVTTSNDGTVRAWDVERQVEVHCHRPHRGAVLSVALLPGDQELVTSGLGGEVLRWELESGRIRARLVGHDQQVSTVVHDPDRDQLVTAGFDGVRAWSESASDVLAIPVCEYAGRPALEPGGDRVACPGSDGLLRIHTLEGAEVEPWRPDRRRADVVGYRMASAWTPMGLAVMNLEEEGYVVRLVEDPERRALATLDVSDPDQSVALEWLRQARQLVAFSSEHGKLLLREGGAPGEVREIEPPGPVNAVAESPDGTVLATVGLELHLWSLPNGEHFQELDSVGLDTVHWGAAFDRDGSRLFVASDAGVSVHAVDGSAPPATIPRTRAACGVAMHPTEPRLAVGHLDGRVSIVDTVRREHLVTLRGHTAAVRSVLFSEDGRSLVSVGSEGVMRVWTTD